MQALDAPQDHQRAVEILHPAAEADGDQQVVGDLVILLPERVLAPGDGLLQPVIGIGEFAGGGAHAGEAFEDVVAQRIVLGRLLEPVPRRGEGLARGLVIALQVECVAVFGELRNGGRDFLLCRETGGQADRDEYMRDAA